MRSSATTCPPIKLLSKNSSFGGLKRSTGGGVYNTPPHFHHFNDLKALVARIFDFKALTRQKFVDFPIKIEFFSKSNFTDSKVNCGKESFENMGIITMHI